MQRGHFAVMHHASMQGTFCLHNAAAAIRCTAYSNRTFKPHIQKGMLIISFIQALFTSSQQLPGFLHPLTEHPPFSASELF